MNPCMTLQEEYKTSPDDLIKESMVCKAMMGRKGGFLKQMRSLQEGQSINLLVDRCGDVYNQLRCNIQSSKVQTHPFEHMQAN